MSRPYTVFQVLRTGRVKGEREEVSKRDSCCWSLHTPFVSSSFSQVSLFSFPLPFRIPRPSLPLYWFIFPRKETELWLVLPVPLYSFLPLPRAPQNSQTQEEQLWSREERGRIYIFPRSRFAPKKKNLTKESQEEHLFLSKSERTGSTSSTFSPDNFAHLSLSLSIT